MRSHGRSPLDDDDLLSEILLRLPPQPSSLPRASLVCKRWRGLASDPGFCRRFRIHHCRNPPLLGVFDRYLTSPFLPTLEAPNRVSPGRFSPQINGSMRFRSLGCHHGLVLIFDWAIWALPHFLVWDPIHGDQHHITLPPGLHAGRARINGAVLRRAAGDVHFQVVLVAALADGDPEGKISVFTCVYSSETGSWGDLFSTLITGECHVDLKSAVLVGDSLYWILVTTTLGDVFDSKRQIVEFDLKRQSLAAIELPVGMLKHGRITLMRAGGGGQGFFFVSNFTAQLWKRETDCNSVASWVLGRTIELDQLLSLNSEFESPIISGYAEENNLVFLATVEGVFMVQLESLPFTKLSGAVGFSDYHPFESVYTTETGIGGGHDGANLFQNI